MTWKRPTAAIGLIALLLLCLAAVGVVPFAVQRAAAEEGGEGITIPETPVTTTPETPVTTTPEAPVTTTPETPVRTPVPTAPSTGTSGNAGPTRSIEINEDHAGSSESSSGGGSVNSGGSATTGTTAAGGRARHGSSQRDHTSTAGGGGAKSGGQIGSGGGGGEEHAQSRGGGDEAPPVSVQPFDEGATAVSSVASRVGEVFARALPTAPLRKLGTKLAAHAGLIPAKSGIAQQRAVSTLGTALGAALVRPPAGASGSAPKHELLPFEPPGGGPEVLYLVLIVLFSLALLAFIVRELFNLSRPSHSPAAARPFAAIEVRLESGLAACGRLAGEGSRYLRRISGNAFASLRSLF
jgi:hypothetical protein